MYGASFPLNFSHWNWFCTQNIKFPHFSRTFLDIFWKHGYSLARICYFGQIQHIGLDSHSFLVTEFNFEPRFSNFFWNFSRYYLKILLNSPFPKFEHMGHHSHSIFIPEFIFVLRVKQFNCFYLFEIQESKNSKRIPNHIIKITMGLKLPSYTYRNSIRNSMIKLKTKLKNDFFDIVTKYSGFFD